MSQGSRRAEHIPDNSWIARGDGSRAGLRLGEVRELTDNGVFGVVLFCFQFVFNSFIEI